MALEIALDEELFIGLESKYNGLLTPALLLLHSGINALAPDGRFPSSHAILQKIGAASCRCDLDTEAADIAAPDISIARIQLELFN